jgi:hypothetical protein
VGFLAPSLVKNPSELKVVLNGLTPFFITVKKVETSGGPWFVK